MFLDICSMCVSVSGCACKQLCIFVNAQNPILKQFITLQQVKQLLYKKYNWCKKQINDAPVWIAGMFSAFAAPYIHDRS